MRISQDSSPDATARLRRASAISLLLLPLAQSAIAGPLEEARWLAPGVDRAAALSVSPGECFAPPEDAETAYLAEVGRAAFNSPRLLGGQASRAGLSCASCHVDGQSNPDFHLQGLSGAPGTADVTSSIFSEVREDGVFNPVRIPTLVGAADRASFGSMAPTASLHDFVAAAVVDEFRAETPAGTVLEGLVAYISALDADACADGPVARSPRRAMDDVRRVLNAAGKAYARNDVAAADFLLVSAQAGLGTVSARFPAPQHAGLREELEAVSRKIAEIRAEPDSAAAQAKLGRILRSVKTLSKRLHRERAASLYDRRRLQEYFARREGD